MLFLLPTDTCYWLAWSFTREDFEAINALKWRDENKRLALLVEDFEDMKKYVIISNEQIEFLEKYPYPWSFLWRRNPEFTLPEFMEDKQYEMISLRVAKICVPNDEFRMTNDEYPFFLTSANLSGQSEAKTLEEAKLVFPWITWIEGWVCNRPPSDIFSIGTNGELEYLRRKYWLI